MKEAEKLMSKLKSLKRLASKEQHQHEDSYSSRALVTQMRNVKLDLYSSSSNANEASTQEPNDVVFNSLINGYLKKNDMKKAFETYEKMKNSGMEMKDRTYNMLLTAYAKKGDSARVSLLMKEMKERGLTPDVFVYNTLLNNVEARRVGVEEGGGEGGGVEEVGEGGRKDEARVILEMMEKQGVRPNVVTYNTVLSRYVKEGKFSQALKLFEEMKSKSMGDEEEEGGEQESIKPNLLTYSTLIHGFGKKGEMDRALLLFEDMKNDGITPDIRIYR